MKNYLNLFWFLYFMKKNKTLISIVLIIVLFFLFFKTQINKENLSGISYSCLYDNKTLDISCSEGIQIVGNSKYMLPGSGIKENNPELLGNKVNLYDIHISNFKKEIGACPQCVPFENYSESFLKNSFANPEQVVTLYDGNKSYEKIVKNSGYYEINTTHTLLESRRFFYCNTGQSLSPDVDTGELIHIKGSEGYKAASCWYIFYRIDFFKEYYVCNHFGDYSLRDKCFALQED